MTQGPLPGLGVAARPRVPLHLLAYLLSLPERTVRAVAAILGTLAFAATHLIPRPIREARFYRLVVERNIKTLADDVGQAGIFPSALALDAATARRLAIGGVADNLMMVGLHASPLWILLAASDVSRGARAFVAELGQELKQAGVMRSGAPLDSLDEVLGGLSRLSERLASTVDMPPLSVADMKGVVGSLRTEVRQLGEAAQDVAQFDVLAEQLRSTAADAEQSLLATTGHVAMGTLKSAGNVLRGGVIGTATAMRFMHRVVWQDVIGDYVTTLQAIRRRGFFGSLAGLMRPQGRGILKAFAYARLTLTERALCLGRWNTAAWRKVG